MTGETNLSVLVANLSPVLRDEAFVFCFLADAAELASRSLRPLSTFQEDGGVSLIIEKAEAENEQLAFDGVFRCISLGVQSSLNAVGLTAHVSSILAQHDISANVVAAFHHDHIFVPEDKAALALKLLVS